jgi:hypothetical protein
MTERPLWTPDSAAVTGSGLWRFMAPLGLKSYEEALRFSVDQPEAFWSELWDFCGVKAETRGTRVLVDGHLMPGAKFFPDARLNYAENLLRRTDDSDALIFRGEDKVRRRMSWAELNREVARLHRALKASGIKAGDRIAAIVPNMPEAIVCFLAASSLGAIWSSCSPDFGERGILDRFGQIGPRVLITCDGYFYAGKTIRMRDKVANVLRGGGNGPGTAQWHDASALHAGPEPRAHLLRAAALRSSALYSLLVGNDRHSQMHRAWRGRYLAQAPFGACAEHRHARERQAVLFLHLRLDDVELAGLRPCCRCYAAAL